MQTTTTTRPADRDAWTPAPSAGPRETTCEPGCPFCLGPETD